MQASEFEAAWKQASERASWKWHIPKPVPGAQPLNGCLSHHTLGTLQWFGVYDREQLRRMSDSDLLRLPNLGRKKLAEIREFMPASNPDPLTGKARVTAQHIEGWQDVWIEPLSTGAVEEHTDRLEVPGGWLYRVVRPGRNSSMMCMCFVPDVTREDGL